MLFFMILFSSYKADLKSRVKTAKKPPSGINQSNHSGKKEDCSSTVTLAGSGAYTCDKTGVITSYALTASCTKTVSGLPSETICYQATQQATSCAAAKREAAVAAKVAELSAACQQTTIDWIDDNP